MRTESGADGERYPTGWRRADGEPAHGVLVLGDHGLRLEGRGPAGTTAETVPYTAIAAVRIGRTPADRINGRASVVVEQRGRPTLFIAPHGIGLISEVTELLTALTAAAASQSGSLLVIAPLRDGAAAKARELVAAGPPVVFAELGVDRHRVFVTEREAVFSFSGDGVGALLDGGLRNPLLWRALVAWRLLLAGRPRVASMVYSWPPR